MTTVLPRSAPLRRPAAQASADGVLDRLANFVPDDPKTGLNASLEGVHRRNAEATRPTLPQAAGNPEPAAAPRPKAPLPQVEEQLLLPAEAAARLNISLKALEHMRRRGGPAFVRLGRRCVRYAVQDLDEFVRSRTTGTADAQ